MAHWYPEGYVHPSSTAYPPGPQHPAHTSRIQVAPGQHPPWYAATHSVGPTTSSSHPRRSFHSQSTSSSRTPRGSSSAGSGAAAHVVEPIKDCVDGINYFKIGRVVLVRKKMRSGPGWTSWVYGEILRPHMSEYERDHEKQGRAYIVRYVDPIQRTLKEDKFYPSREELQDVQVSHKYQANTVLAYTGPVTEALGVPLEAPGLWVSADILRSTDQGLLVRPLSGPGKGRDILSTKIMPYSAPRTTQNSTKA